MRREDDRRLVTEVLIESGDRMQLRILDPDAGPPGLLDLLAHHARAGDQVTLVHVGDTWTASTLSHEWPFGPELATNLLADRNPKVVERAESRVLQVGSAGGFAVVSTPGPSHQPLPRWILGVTRHPVSLVVGRVRRDRTLRLATFSRSSQFLARVAGREGDGPQEPVPAEILSRRAPARSTVYRLAFAFPPVRRERLDGAGTAPEHGPDGGSGQRGVDDR